LSNICGGHLINGYRKACRHFGYRTLEDPTTVGNDDWRLLIHKEMKKLRRAARVLNETDNDGVVSDELYDQKEEWLQFERGVTWFHHDWRHWYWREDKNTFEELRWDGIITECKDYYRVTIHKTKPHSI
jgi:hypothetical protein